jgi:hypothetical protein
MAALGLFLCALHGKISSFLFPSQMWSLNIWPHFFSLLHSYILTKFTGTPPEPTTLKQTLEDQMELVCGTKLKEVTPQMQVYNTLESFWNL